ncbi:MAG: class I SAM-dependent methyltransferase [Candidatus Magasanikbacteria bacterium]
MDSPQDTIRQTKDIYNKIASFFSDTRKYVRESEKELVKYTKDGDNMLDLGCGNGKLYHLFDKMQVTYTGMDLSGELLAIARKKWSEVVFVEGNMAETFPFQNNTFDIIYCIAAFHHLPDKETRLKALGEMKRVLKKDGRLIMKNWNLGSDWANKKVEKGKYTKIGDNDFIVPWRDPQGNILGDRYYHSFTEDELKQLFEESGFVIDEQYFEQEPYLSDSRGGRNIVSVVHKN